MSILEQYGMNIPLLFPSLDLQTDWHHEFYFMNERTWDGVGGRRPSAAYIPPHVSSRNSSVPSPHNEWDRAAIRHWLQYSDFYTLPHVLHFSSVDTLVGMLESYWTESGRGRLRAVSEAMRAHNRERLLKTLRYWREKLTHIARNSPNRPH